MWSTKTQLGFIAPETNSGEIVLPDSKREKRNGKGKVKQQRAVRQKYVFVIASKRGQKYRDYFNPDNAVQLRVMGMEDILVRTTFTRDALTTSDRLVQDRIAHRGPPFPRHPVKQVTPLRGQILRSWIADATRCD